MAYSLTFSHDPSWSTFPGGSAAPTACIEAAVNELISFVDTSVFNTPVTYFTSYGNATTGPWTGQPGLPAANYIANTSYTSDTYPTFAQAKSELTAFTPNNTVMTSAQASIPAVDPGWGGVKIPSPASSLLGKSAIAVNFFTAFSTAQTWDISTDPNHVPTGFGIYDNSQHEFSEGFFGRVSWTDATNNTYGPLDWFAFTAAATRNLTKGPRTGTTYVSHDSGTTNLATMNNGAGDFGDWAAGTTSPFSASANANTNYRLLANDVKVITTIGFPLSPAGKIFAGLSTGFAATGESNLSFTGNAIAQALFAMTGESALSFTGKNASAPRGRLKLGH